MTDGAVTTGGAALSAPPQPIEAAVPPRTKKTLTVMVVDDSLVMTQLVTKVLNELGHKVVITAKTGAEAIDSYARHKPDLVTMDITMPGMSGVEAAQKIMQAHPTACIIMVSSHAEQNLVLDSLKAGAKGYVLKPVKNDALQRNIEKVFGKM